MTTTEFSLRGVIAQLLTDTTESVDPRDIAEKVALLIPREQKHRILVDALVAEVRTVMTTRRNTALTKSFAPSSRPVIGGSIQSAPKVRSPKVEQIRDWWAELLRSNIYIGDGYKTLGQCGAAELLFAETHRRDKAEQETARAKQYMRLRQLLDQHQVQTVAELPPDSVKAVW